MLSSGRKDAFSGHRIWKAPELEISARGRRIKSEKRTFCEARILAAHRTRDSGCEIVVGKAASTMDDERVFGRKSTAEASNGAYGRRAAILSRASSISVNAGESRFELMAFAWRSY